MSPRQPGVLRLGELRATLALGEESPPRCLTGSQPASQLEVAVAEHVSDDGVSDDGGADVSDVGGAANWELLEQQLEKLKAMQDDFRKSLDDQVRHISSLQNFARDQARIAACNGFVPQAAQDTKHRDSGAMAAVDARGSTPSAIGEVMLAYSASSEASSMCRRESVNSVDSRVSLERSWSLPAIELKDYSSHTRLATPRTKRYVRMPSIKRGVVPWVRAAAHNLLFWRLFEPMMGIVIVLNAINIGWAIDSELKHQDTKLQTANEAVFLGIFILELLLRIFVQGLRCLKTLANLFDFVLVIVTTTTMIIEPLLAVWGGEELAKYLQQLMILRMLRLLRLARAVRLVHSFRSMWKLVQGLWHCFGTMMSALVLMFISMYVFACFGAELITKQLSGDPEVGQVVASGFATLPNIILTLCQFIMMDSTAAFYVPLIHRSPGLAVYFVLLLMTVTIALMNLVTALVVEDAISQAQMDEEMKGYYLRRRLRKLEPAMRQLFRSLDENKDGYVQIEEVVNAVRSGNLRIPTELQDLLNPARMLDLFEALDADQSGDLSENELVDGLTGVALSDVSLETMQILHILRLIKKDLKRSIGPSRSPSKTPVWRSQRCSETNPPFDYNRGDPHLDLDAAPCTAPFSLAC